MNYNVKYMITDYPLSTPNERAYLPSTSVVTPTEIQPDVSRGPVILRGNMLF